jgi:predicted ATPase
VLLVAGEAGAGKTRLVEAALSSEELTILAGRATMQTTPPYGPIVAALRDYIRQVPGSFVTCGSLTQYLSLILPELGAAPIANRRLSFSTIYSGLTTPRSNSCPSWPSRWHVRPCS